MSFLKRRRWKGIQLLQPKAELSNEAALRKLKITENGSVDTTSGSDGGRRIGPIIESSSNEGNATTKPSLWNHAYISFAEKDASAESMAIATYLLSLSKQQPATAPTVDDISDGLSSEWWLCREVIHLAKARQSAIANQSDKPFFRQLRRAYRGILQWSQKFMALGDIVAQIDPVHVGLPWAGIKAIMIISIHNAGMEAEVLQSMAYISRLICRFAVFENVYLHKEKSIKDLLAIQLRSSLETLYSNVLQYLIEVLLYLNRSSKGKAFGSIALSDHLRKLYSRIEDSENEILKYESMAIKSSSYDQFVEVRNRLCFYEDHLQGQTRKGVSDWISQIPYYTHHRDLNSSICPGTGDWLFATSEFGNWASSDQSSVFWLRGEAGTGKTSLVSWVIEDALREPKLDNEQALAYFYCSRTTSDPRQQDVRAIMLSLIRQLAAPLPGLPLKQPIISVFERETARGSPTAHLSITELKSLLTELVEEHYQYVTIILDALDEVDGRGRLDFLDFLTTLTYNPKTRVKTFFSSRNDSDFRSHLSNVSSLSITFVENAGDVRKFVSNELQIRLLDGRASQELRDRVSSYLEQNAHGVFRWVVIQVDTLCDPDRVYSEQDVEQLLQSLPVTLEETYARIMNEINRLAPASHQAITTILKIMVCAEMALDATELAGALRALSGNDKDSWEELKILKMGKSFIKTEDRGEPLVFAHLSVPEFLERQPGFSIEECHALAAEACLRVFLDSSITECQFGMFNAYALHFLGRHTTKSGNFRHKSNLRALLEAFILPGHAVDAFARWNHACFKYEVGVELELWHENRHCQSLPSSPLFMACVYGFGEFIGPLVAHSDRVLYSENALGLRPLEVATWYNNTALLNSLYDATISAHCKSSIRSANWLKAAAISKESHIWTYVAQRIDDFPPQSAVVYAVSNANYAEVVADLLMKVRQVKPTILLGTLYGCASFELLEMVLAKCPSLTFTQEMLVAAVSNRFLNPGLTQRILSNYPAVFVSENCVCVPFETAYSEPSLELVEALLCHTNRCEITEELVLRIIKLYGGQDIECIKLLTKHCSKNHVTEDWLIAAASNAFAGPLLFEYMLHNFAEGDITQQVLQSAMSNKRRAWINLKVIVSQSKCHTIADETVYIAAQNWSIDAPIFSLAFDVWDPKRITPELFEACVATKGIQEIRDFLYMARWTPISQNVIFAGLKNPTDAVNIAELLLQSSGLQIEVSEKQLDEILAHHARMSRDVFVPQGPRVVRMLARYCLNLPITENTLIAALEESSTSCSTVEVLVDECDSPELILTVSVLDAALRVGNEGFVSYFQSMKPDFVVEEAHLVTAIHQCGTKSTMLQMLLGHKNRCSITASLLRAAASSENQNALELLLKECRSTEDLTMHLETSRQQRQDITGFATILAAFSEYDHHGTRSFNMNTLRLHSLLSKSSISDDESNQLVEAATKQENGRFIIQYLLTRFPRTVVTRRAIEIALSNEGTTLSMLRFLLDYYSGELDVKLLKLAARNRHRGTDFVELLLNRCITDRSTEKDVLLVALENPFCGRSLLNLFLSRDPNLTIDEAIIDAAFRNKTQNIVLLQLFLEMTLGAGLHEVAGMIHEKLSSMPYGVRDSVFMAACHNDELVLKYLISRGAPLNQVSGELGIALNVAVAAGNEKMVELLLAAGSDPDTYSKLYGTPLRKAIKSCKQAITLLAKYGATLDLPGSMGRTTLQLSVRQNQPDITKLLISLGASKEKQDLQGMDALHHAALEPDLSECINVLLGSGHVVEQEDTAGFTALHWAAKAGNIETVTLLLDAGFGKDRKDHAGRTPYQIAMFCGNFHLRPRLLPTDRHGLDGEVYRREHHSGVICDACDLQMQGPRFKCIECLDFDFCFRCIIDAEKIHDPKHAFKELHV